MRLEHAREEARQQCASIEGKARALKGVIMSNELLLVRAPGESVSIALSSRAIGRLSK